MTLANTFTKTLTAPSTNCIAQSQSVAAGTNAVLNGGSVVTVGNGVFGANVTQAVLDAQRRIVVVSAGNDGTNTVRLYGNLNGGQPINEVLALTNGGTAVSQLDYKAVTRASFPTGTAGNVTIGTNGTGSTQWVVPNYDISPFNAQIQVQLSGSVTYNLETTLDRQFWDPPTGTGAVSPQPNVNLIASGSTIAQSFALTQPVTGLRFTITSGTGTLTAQVQQAGLSNM